MRRLLAFAALLACLNVHAAPASAESVETLLAVTKVEIDGLIAFYASPAGQAFINKMPVVLQKSMAISQSLMQSLMPKMSAAMKEAMTEAKIQKQPN